jgi:hypothetical protein
MRAGLGHLIPSFTRQGLRVTSNAGFGQAKTGRGLDLRVISNAGFGQVKTGCGVVMP